jgi:hypothetical protein
MNRRTFTVTAAAIAIAGLAWIDPLFVPLVTLGPLVAGFAAGAAGVDVRTAALPWLFGGVLMLVSDLVINNEDVLFHAVVALFTAGLSAAMAALGGTLRRRRAPARPVTD